jgi:tripartite-type tricarboxylate transporter receptor subunit TctC
MKPTLLRLAFGCVSLIAAMGLHNAPAGAQSYPGRPVKLIVPYPPGATADLIGRIIAQNLSQFTGGQFYVENLPGAGGTIGTGTAARAPADGHTLLLVNQDFVVQALVKPKTPYDPLQSFMPVAVLAAAPETISVHPLVPAAGMRDLIALLKSNPGKYSYASPGYGTSPHIASERLFRLTLATDVLHVPFQGGAPAITSTLAGHTQILHITLPLIAPHLKEGKLRALAVADNRRHQILPEVPTLEEAGIPNHEVGYWSGILTPAGTRPEIVHLLNREIAKALSQPAVKERLATIGFTPRVGTPEDFAKHIERELTEWARVVREAKIKID